MGQMGNFASSSLLSHLSIGIEEEKVGMIVVVAVGSFGWRRGKREQG